MKQRPKTMNLLEKAHEGVSYAKYIQDLEQSLEKRTEKSKMLNYVDLNLRRMKRIFKQYEPAPYLARLVRQINQPITWLAISEGWCGDAAHVLPVLERLAQISFKPELKIVMRDEHPELMDQFLTNGSRSIPIIIAVDGEGELISKWGPRPSHAQKMVEDYKEGISNYSNYEELSAALQKWYHYDKFITFESEIVEFIEPQIRAKELVRINS